MANCDYFTAGSPQLEIIKYDIKLQSMQISAQVVDSNKGGITT